MLNNRLPFRTAGKSGRGGFTLVELLVVIAIIALLASVAIGPITHAMSVAKDNAGMQTTHSLYLADFQYSIDNNAFVTGTDSGEIAKNLLKGGYISDPSIFYLAGGATTKYTGGAAATSMTGANVSWDFLAISTTSGLTTSDPDQLPLVWSTGNTITIPATGNYGPATVNTAGKNAYGTDGIPVAYKSGASKFQKVDDVTTGTISKFIDNSYVAPASTTYVILKGQ